MPADRGFGCAAPALTRVRAAGVRAGVQLISVALVLLFGEILPQALCKAYSLTIGAYTAPFSASTALPPRGLCICLVSAC